MCGEKRIENSNFCPNCNFEFLTGEYIKVEVEEITVEKVSPEDFVKANESMQETSLKINTLISKYLNYALTNQFNESYDEKIPLLIKGYIISNLNSEVSADFNDNFLESLKALLNDEKYIDSKTTFLQWIAENRSHLPGIALNQYLIPHQESANMIEEILDLDLADSEENRLFIELLNEFLNSEKEFIEGLL